MNHIFPFTAIVGMELVKKSLLYHAIDPRLGGVLLMGHRGCAKSTLARAFKEILPTQNSSIEIPFVEVPLGTSEDRLVGSIDASLLLKKGEWSSKIGLIQQANGGVLYIDEVNLLADHLVDSLLDSAISGQHHIEREGISETVNARYILIGSMNPEEGDLRPQLTDRFTHGIFIQDEFSIEQRKEIVRIRMDFDDNPEVFVNEHKTKMECLKKQISDARMNLKNVKISDKFRNEVAEKAISLKLEGVRAELGVIRTVRCAAAWRGETSVTYDDLEEAWILCMGHREEQSPSKTNNSKPKKNSPEPSFEKSGREFLKMTKTSINPTTSRKEGVLLDSSKCVAPNELYSWWRNHKFNRSLSPIDLNKSVNVQGNLRLARISWYTSLQASILRGWFPGRPWSLRYKKPERRNNFWIFLDASRSTGAISFLGEALSAIKTLGSRTYRSRFYVLVLQNGKLSWWIKRGTVKAFKESLDRLTEASGKSNLVLAFYKLNAAIKKQGFLYGDRALICSDGMFNSENERSISQTKKRFQKTLRVISEKVNLAWFHPQFQRGMRYWLKNLVKGKDIHLISLNNNGNQSK